MSSWTPNESSQTILTEEGWLQSTVVSAVAYGIDVALYFMCFNLLFQQIRTRKNYKQPLFLLVYITVSFILGTLFIASLADFTQLAFIQDRNYPGGPSAFEDQMFSIPIDNLGNVTGILIMLLTDALVVSTKLHVGDLIFMSLNTGLALHGRLHWVQIPTVDHHDFSLVDVRCMYWLVTSLCV
jgi:hypothetical protein